MAHPRSMSSSAPGRVLGLGGILGGSVLLAAFLLDIAPGFNVLRIILFNAGAVAIIIGVNRRQASAAPVLALFGAVPACLANGWYLVMVLLAIGRPHPFAGDFGFVFFSAGVVMWLTDALFALVTLRLAEVGRWGALALAIGSVLAITGIDRLGLASPANPTIFGPLSEVGVALNGIGWILIGLDLVAGRRTPDPQAAKVRTGA